MNKKSKIYHIPLEPIPQGRPRAYRRGNTIGMHDPARSAEYKRKIQEILKEYEPALIPENRAIRLSLVCVMTPPKSRAHESHPAGGADVDNLAKAIMDASTGILWHDDRQVQELSIKKLWQNFEQRVGTTIYVSQIDQEDISALMHNSDLFCFD